MIKRVAVKGYKSLDDFVRDFRSAIRACGGRGGDPV